MTLHCNVRDPVSEVGLTINDFGQAAVGPLDFSTPSAQTVTATGTAFNFISPRPDQFIVITHISVIAGKTAPVGGSIVQVYEANSKIDLTIDKLLFPFDLPRQVPATQSNLNLRVPPGKFVNVQSDGAPILVSILFYRAPIKKVNT